MTFEINVPSNYICASEALFSELESIFQSNTLVSIHSIHIALEKLKGVVPFYVHPELENSSSHMNHRIRNIEEGVDCKFDA